MHRSLLGTWRGVSGTGVAAPAEWGWLSMRTGWATGILFVAATQLMATDCAAFGPQGFPARRLTPASAASQAQVDAAFRALDDLKASKRSPKTDATLAAPEPCLKQRPRWRNHAARREGCPPL